VASDPVELPRPAQRVMIALGKRRYALDVRISPLPDKSADVVEMPKPKEEAL
jgi:hypothetical protein